jgi:hypothetical protein
VCYNERAVPLISPPRCSAGAGSLSVYFYRIQEIDTPGHTAVISNSHPEYAACVEATPWSTYTNEPPVGQLRLASPGTINFTVDMLSAVAGLFPSTLFSHLHGWRDH